MSIHKIYSIIRRRKWWLFLSIIGSIYLSISERILMENLHLINFLDTTYRDLNHWRINLFFLDVTFNVSYIMFTRKNINPSNHCLLKYYNYEREKIFIIRIYPNIWAFPIILYTNILNIDWHSFVENYYRKEINISYIFKDRW